MSQYLDKDGASRIAENFLSKQAEQDSILRKLQFDLKEAEHALVKTVQGPAPLNIRALSRPLTDYTIYGNTIQDGTPTPEAPVDVVGCGVRTGNLFDYQTMGGTIKGYYLDIYGELQPSDLAAVTDYIPCSGGSFALDKIGGISPSICLYDENKQFLYGKAYNTPSGSDKRIIIVDTSLNASFIRFSYFYTHIPRDDLSAIMLNAGTTALPYEPYGYKLPITVNGTEYLIYLGEVQTTRKIRKFVLDGTEGWGLSGNATYRINVDGALKTIYNVPFCESYSGQSPVSGYASVNDNCIALHNTAKYLYIHDGRYPGLNDFISYLAAQYSAGTPVTVWYVLANEETGIVNDPLMKIGDYADTISMTQSGVEISTTKGFNTITTDTTVLPSNIEVKGVINNA